VVIFFLSFPIFFISTSSLGQDNVSLTILYTGNVQGNINPCGCSKNQLGGIGSRASILRFWKDKEKGFSIVVDSGDAFTSPRLFEAFNKAKRDFLVKAMNYMGYDLLNIGDTEFGFNRTALTELRSEAKFVFLSANIIDKITNKPLFTPYIIREIAGLKLAFLGLITNELPARIPPQHISQLLFVNPIKSAQEYVPLLKKKSDLVIVLSHLGLSQAKALAGSLPDIDIIIEGHGGKVLFDPIVVGKILILYPGDRGQYVGLLRLKFNHQKGVSSYKNELIPVDQELYAPDPHIQTLLKAYLTKERKGNIYGRDDRRKKLTLTPPQPVRE
jgi:2',3'-cyclic-nucleotide 2'-phosphodiesterase (5'-nucleotidase family)